MVSPAVQQVVEQLSAQERWELMVYLEDTLVTPELTEEQKDLIRSRDAEIDANPGLLMSRDEVIASLRDLRAR